MARLVIVLDVDLDPTVEDPEKVANDIVYDEYLPEDARQTCGTVLVSATWEER